MPLARTLRSAAALAEAGLIPEERTPALASVAERYALAITPALAALIDAADPADPIAKQFIPSEAELTVLPSERADPIGDARHTPVPGIVHRYKDRVLLKLTLMCPVYCRFCFRREMVGPGEDSTLDGQALDAALAYIAAHDEIWEVILTGGDPFVLSPRRIAEVARALGRIPHVKVLRWHTRVPVADPERVTPDLVAALKESGRTTYIVIHANHPRELTPDARTACARLSEAGLSLLSQSVLLAGVNDDAEILIGLMRALVEIGIKPYYLHHADLAPGTAHFRTSIEKGQALMEELRARASGLCLPTYVLDIPGGHAKANLTPPDIEMKENSTRLRDADGAWHTYAPPPFGPTR